MEEILKSIGNRIKTLRKEKKLSQQDVADYLGIRRPTLSKIENGEISLALKHIFKLCALFKVSIEFLLTGKQSTELPDFQEMNSKIIQMLNEMAMNPSLMHAMLSHYYIKRFEFAKYKREEKENEETTGTGEVK